MSRPDATASTVDTGRLAALGLRDLAKPRFAILIAGILAVIAVAVLAITTLVSGERQGDRADHAAGVRGRARQVVIDLLQTETAQRAFLLTGEADERGEYVAARATAVASVDALVDRAPDSLDPIVEELLTAVRAKLTELDTTIGLVDAGQRDLAVAAMRTGIGHAAMYQALRALDEVIDELSEVQRARAAARREQVRQAIVVVAVGSTLAVVALAFGLVVLRRYTRARSVAIGQAQALAVELDERRRAVSAAAAKLAKANQALARSNRDLDQFAYVASHDLKAPLRGITSLAGWIEEDLGDRLDDKVREHLRLMRTRIERLELLIEGILAYSRAGRPGIKPEPVDTEASVRHAVELASPPAEVELVIAPGPWPTLTTVAVQLEQVWLNLIGNAIKHGRSDDGRARIVVCCHGRRDEGWEFSVADGGVGIPAEFRDRVFEMFQRLQPRDAVEGAGIGLAVVRKLVGLSGGRVWIDSPAGGGTAFHFTWSEARE